MTKTMQYLRLLYYIELLGLTTVFASEAGRKYSEDYVTDLSWCRSLKRYFDWERLLQLQRQCQLVEVDLVAIMGGSAGTREDLFLCEDAGEGEEPVIIEVEGNLKSYNEVEAYAWDAVEFALDWQWARSSEYMCANGLVTATLILLHKHAKLTSTSSALAAGKSYDLVRKKNATEDDGEQEEVLLSFPLDRSRKIQIEALLRRMADRVFLLDASLWGAKSFLIKSYFDTFAVGAQPGVGTTTIPESGPVTFLVPRLTQQLATHLLEHFADQLVLTFKPPSNTATLRNSKPKEVPQDDPALETPESEDELVLQSSVARRQAKHVEEENHDLHGEEDGNFAWWHALVGELQGRRNWVFFDRSFPDGEEDANLGILVNGMAENVPTVLSFVVLNAALVVKDKNSLSQLIRYQTQADVTGGSYGLLTVGEERRTSAGRTPGNRQPGGPREKVAKTVWNDWCYQLTAHDWQLSFSAVYQESLLRLGGGNNEQVKVTSEGEPVAEEEKVLGASIRGYWFESSEEDSIEKDDTFPAKVCDATSPSFLIKTSLLKQIPLDPEIQHADLLALEYFLRLQKLRFPTVAGGGVGGPPSSNSRIATGGTSSPFLQVAAPVAAEMEVLNQEDGSLLYGSAVFASTPTDVLAERWRRYGKNVFAKVTDLRQVRPPTYNFAAAAPAAPASPTCASCTSALTTAADPAPAYVLPQRTSPTAVSASTITFHRPPLFNLGCHLKMANCEIPLWVYRGWTAPPCCRETLKRLLFYITDLFERLQIRYLLTDGGLLGALKYGQLIRWDADIDLQIHPADFQKYFVEKANLNGTSLETIITNDGFYLRRHETSKTQFLLQANKQNYLLIELNNREYDKFFEEEEESKPLYAPVDEGKLLRIPKRPLQKVRNWYGYSFLANKLRHVPEWEEMENPLFCGTVFHHNCANGQLGGFTSAVPRVVKL
eukprot:g10443.t1